MMAEGTPSIVEATRAIGDASVFMRLGEQATPELLASLTAAARGGLMGWEQVRSEFKDRPEFARLLTLADDQIRVWKEFGSQVRQAKSRATQDLLTR
jgi:hypothetical protein